MLLLRAGGGGGLAPPTANMAARWMKGLGITDVANAVSQWDDQSSNARHQIQLTGANQPTKQGDGTILCNGTTQFLQALFTLPQPFTGHWRIRPVTFTIGDRLLDGGTINTAAVRQVVGTPQIDLFSGSGAAANTELTVGAWSSLCVYFNGASSFIQVNAGTPTTGNPGGTAAGGITIGASGDGTNPSNILVAEGIIYTGVDDPARRALVQAYLATVI